MNFYPHHIGDYRAATTHLSNEEDLAYRRLLEMYYDTEKPIPLDTQWVSRRLRVGTEPLAIVLKDFFIIHDDGYHHVRCEYEIAEYVRKADTARANGKKGGRRKAASALENNPLGYPLVPTAIQLGTQALSNQEPRTKNQEPIKTAVAKKIARTPLVAIKTFLENCKAISEKPIPEGHYIFDYAEKAGIPVEFLRLAWREFVDAHSDGDKKYRDWRKAFLNSVKRNWYQLWWIDSNGVYQLTTKGKQADRFHVEAA